MLFELDKQWVIEVKISLRGMQTEMAKREWEHYGLENQSFHSKPSVKEVQCSEEGALLRGAGSCDLCTAIVRLSVRGAGQITCIMEREMET